MPFKNAFLPDFQSTNSRIHVNLNQEIARINALYSAIAPPLAAALTAAAITRSNISLATIGATTVLGFAKKTKQKKEGGWLNVVGEDDNITYNARYIGQPITGMLPDHPVLISSATGQSVLASERGREYFVSNKDLQKPAILNHVRAIDNLTKAKQMQGGGFLPGAPVQSPAGDGVTIDRETYTMLISLLNQLADVFSEPIKAYAVIDDDTIINQRKRYLKIVKGSGLDSLD